MNGQPQYTDAVLEALGELCPQQPAETVEEPTGLCRYFVAVEDSEFSGRATFTDVAAILRTIANQITEREADSG